MRIAIASGKGGAGKTSVAASLASVWDSPLVAVDTDVEAPNLHLFLPPQVEGSSKAWLEVPSLDLAACSKCGKCREICSFKAIASFAGNISIFPSVRTRPSSPWAGSWANWNTARCWTVRSASSWGVPVSANP